MSGRTGVWRRPRTKVYDANFYAGESYYKSALEGLDKKYGRTSAPAEATPAATNGSMSALRASLERERPARRPLLIEDDDSEDRPRRKPNTSALLDEFDSIFEGRSKATNGIKREKTPSRALKVMDDEVDHDFEESMKRIRAARSARAAAEDMEEIDNNLSSRKKEVRAKLNFSSKVMDSVGLSESSSATRNKKVLSIVSDPTDSEDMTRWTKLETGRRHVLDDDEGKAVQRAQKSRARLEDLETEMAQLEQRGAAREKRVRDLRSLLSENESNSKETIHSTVRVKSSIKTEKKQVAF